MKKTFVITVEYPDNDVIPSDEVMEVTQECIKNHPERYFGANIMDGEYSRIKVKEVTDEFTLRQKAIENAIYLIMYNKFGTLDTEGIKSFVSKHNCALCYDEEYNFIGISLNNRWLYTPSGQTIGKEGKRWKIEKIRK